jgi:hypothetical protein
MSPRFFSVYQKKGIETTTNISASRESETDSADAAAFCAFLPSAHRRAPTADPYDTTTQEQTADLTDMNSAEARHAYDLDPWHPLVHLALAGFEEDPILADFLRRYSLDRPPNDPKLR